MRISLISRDCVGQSFGIVYMAVNRINGKRYIGQTVKSLRERMKGHRGQANKGSQFYFHCSIRHHGWEAFDWHEIDSADSIEELNSMESFWIKFYRTMDKSFGYNLRAGGNNSLHVEETRKKISRANKGRTNTPEQMARQIASIKEGFKNGRKSHWLGKHHTAERQDRLRNLAHKTSVLCVETGKFYLSTKEASIDTNVSQGNIAACARGNRQTAGGFCWKYVDEGKRNLAETKRMAKQQFPIDFNAPREVICVETGQIFLSVSLAARNMGLKSACSISNAIRAGGKSASFHWGYVNS